MEDAWHAKCSSAWPPPPPASSPMPPPSTAPALAAPSSGSVNQMGMNSRQFFHPFAQETILGNSAIVQEPMVFNTLNLDSCTSGKAELGSSFLALLSGRSHHASSQFMQLPYSGSVLAKLHVHDDAIAIGASSGVPITSIPPLSENHGNDAIGNAELSPFVASRPLSMPTCTNIPLLHNSFQVAASNCHGPDSGKPVPHQAFQGNNAGIEVSSRKHVWPTASSPSNANQQHILNQTTQKMPLKTRPSISSNSSATFRGRPRVFCMNKVGELFVSDMGLLGILCFCHKLPMSVAKFCEHSGSPSANPGEAVHLENGMTVAQWRKLCFGVMASDHGNGWNWSDGSSAGGLVGSKLSSFPTSSKNSASVNSFESFGGLGKFGEPRNKMVFPHHTYTGFGGQTALEKSANRDTDYAHQRNSLNGHNHFTKSFAGSAQSTMPALAKNHVVQAIKESPMCMSFEGSHLTLNQGEQNVGPQLVANNVNYMGEIGNLPVSFPRSGMKNSFNCENHTSRGNFPSETFVVDQDVSSSNIELRLGHPSQKNNTSVSSFPAAMHPLHLGAVCNLQKPQLHQPVTHRTDYCKETKRPRLNLLRPPSEASSLIRQLQPSVGSNAFKNSESEDPMGDATKNSLISFLSHLNTEGNKSQSTDIVGNYSEYFVTRVLDSDSIYAKCNLSDFMRDLTDGIERKSNTNGYDLSNNIDQGKGLRIVDNGSYSTVKPNYLVHDKQTPDARILSSAIGGPCIHSSSYVNDRQPTLYFNQPSGMLQTAPNCRNSNHYAEVSFLGNRDHSNCAIRKFTGPVPNATARPGSLHSETPICLSSTNSIYISEPTSALSNNKNTDRTQNLRNESLRSLSTWHMAELSKPEQSASSLETSSQHRRLCCLSDVELRRNVCKEDLVATEEPREGPYCITQQDASNIAAKSSHSFSNCYAGGDVQKLAVKPDATGPYKCCNCSASTQRLPLCSKEHGIKFSTCHICHADEQPCLRLGRFSNNSYPGSSKHEMRNHKEESSSFSAKCCCTALPKYLTGCCFSGGDSLSGALKEHVCGKAKIMHVNPTYDRDHMLQDGRRVRLGQCECLRKHVVMKNDCQIALWRDVPNKVVGRSGATKNEKPVQVLQATRIVGDQLTDTAAKELDGARQESESMKEHQMSNVSSGSSAPAVTEVSVEINNVVSFATDVDSSKIVHDFVVDEGSRSEKCGSSDELLDSRECEEAITFKDKVNPINSSSNLTNELGLDRSSDFKRVRNQISAGCTGQENISQMQQYERACKAGKRKGPMKQSRPDESVPMLGFSSIYSESPDHVGHLPHQSSSEEIDPPHQSDNDRQKTCIYFGRSSSVKRKRSALSSTKPFSLKRLENHNKVRECNKVQSIDDDRSLRRWKVSAGKKAKTDLVRDVQTQFAKQKENHVDAGKPPKFLSLSCIGNSPNHRMDTSGNKVRPVVCGNSGIISSGGTSDKQKPAKIVSLSLILKKANRCSIAEYEGKPRLSRILGNKKACLNAKNGCHNVLSSWKLQAENEDSSIVIRSGMDPNNLVSGKNKRCSSKNDKCPYELSIMKRESDCESDKALKSGLHHEDVISVSKPRCKETSKCSLGKLTGTDMHATEPNCLPGLGENEYSDLTEARNQLKTSPSTDIGDALVGNEHCTMKLCSRKVLECASSADARFVTKSENDQDHPGEPCEVNTRRSSKGRKCPSFLSDSDVFCCVCGSSNKEDDNQLLECNRCLIRVHQACYGVSKVPKGRWCCRPCKTNSLNIVCVLCGYGGGAMTRALKSRNIVKSLLKDWKVGTGANLINSVPSSRGIKSESSKPVVVCEASAYDGSIHVVGSIGSETFSGVASETELAKTNTMQHSDSMLNNFQAYNSLTAGMLDPSVTQWVHMVCGLWTPGTRCPNVDTMSTFDVSGASPSRKNSVCSICDRPGGSCIQCRVLNCSVHFHPWCAHQKGLLQSEIEGDDNERVGFYGRCMLHATHSSSHVHSPPVDTEVVSPKDKDWTCSRTEGFKGRKRDEGFNPNHQKPYNDGGGCIVSQEQINAWLHINGQKSCTRGVVKLPCSDMEYDVRKEYIRYKQSKGWKHLVVYKSGIHALGLYTSQFIAQGAMVVEYVGEIVGLRVADKREIEYQSGRRLQYKSACYFFRIDKEHIIDATRKGGIARFVNHSCLPNCVAKVISVRNEKKVVFFAERDIYPGEEITYDYHFNHEDEGKKIPCFCNSKNCRRYLN